MNFPLGRKFIFYIHILSLRDFNYKLYQLKNIYVCSKICFTSDHIPASFPCVVAMHFFTDLSCFYSCPPHPQFTFHIMDSMIFQKHVSCHMTPLLQVLCQLPLYTCNKIQAFSLWPAKPCLIWPLPTSLCPYLLPHTPSFPAFQLLWLCCSLKTRHFFLP